MSFKASDKEKKHISEITSEFKPFWERLFDKMGIGDPIFGAKLCYMGKEFGDPRKECVRFFPNELSSGKDYYLELFNWDQDNYHEGERVLYRHKYDPNWESSNKYVKVPVRSLSTSTYAIKIEHVLFKFAI